MTDDDGLEPLLEFLRDERGFDFTGYKRASLGRRIRKRMHDVGIGEFDDYQGYLQANPGEVASLFDTILINVTAFQRDPEYWEYLCDHVLPDLLARDHGADGIRVWSAGCSTGEEAYTVAMLLCEAMGLEKFQDSVKIYATDVDDDAIQQARRGVYDESRLAALDPVLVERYFEHEGDHYAARREIRRSLIFGRHDLVQDAPISRVDLLVCRNLLMYFTAETQTQILSRLHFALNDDGFLFLGRAEMLLTRSHLFTPRDLKHRVFVKSAESLRSPQLPRPRERLSIPGFSTRSIRLRDLAFMLGTTAQFVVDQDGTLVMANHRASAEFDLRHDAIGRPFTDSEISYRPVELRGHMEEVYREQRTVRLSNVARAIGNGDVQHVDISLTPLEDTERGTIGILITVVDVSASERLRADLQRSKHDLETAYEELQSTNEELLTTNEELQSTVEELETTNEELQSSNEELETMNEELQSANLEHEDVNAELERRSVEQGEHAALSTVGSLGLIVVDPALRIQAWDLQSQDLWGLRTDEVLGEELTSLDCGLPVADVAPLVEGCLRGGEVPPVRMGAVNRRGRSVTCDVRCQPLVEDDVTRGVLVLVHAVERTDAT